MTATRRISKIIKDGIEYNIVGGGSEAVDTQLDITSENPVQNKVIAQAINGKQDALTAGPNVCIYEENDELKICATDTTYTNATQSSAGLMSASDKKKLDGLKSGGLLVGMVDVLVVGGGGAGGTGCTNYWGSAGGGGGGGGVLYCQGKMITQGNYNIVVGSGGAASVSCSCNGGYSCFSDICAAGGGAGGSGLVDGCSGGSGGGAGGCSGDTSRKAGCGTSGQGNNGGKSCCVSGNYSFGGGGGGRGGSGCDASTGGGGNGGNGIAYSITGSTVYYGAGGGGGSGKSGGGRGSGGTGGGGTGAYYCKNGDNGTGYGSGGGGGSVVCRGGGGSNGIVVIRYKKDGSYGIVNATGGTKYACGDYCIHCFTSSGTFCPFN